MRIQNLFRKPAALLALSAPLLMTVTPAAAQQDEFAALANEAAALMHEIALLEDHHQVERLQRAFGYYIDEDMWTAAADLFTADGTYEEGGSGVYVGRDHILAFFQSKDAEGPQYGRLNDQMQLQPVVHVSPDGLHAKGRWHSFSQTAQYQEWSRWGTGVYETSYVKQDGVWKIEAMHLYTTVSTPYEDGWGKTALPISSPSTDVPPDQPPSVVYENYPAVFVAPFHYKPGDRRAGISSNPADYAASAPADATALTALLDDAQHRAGKLADGNEIENLHAVLRLLPGAQSMGPSGWHICQEGTIKLPCAASTKICERPSQSGYMVRPASSSGLMHNHMLVPADHWRCR
ncbi:MAG: nuclear transport factor 2 family protein [Gammaproteobacteria bacterium]|nr:nuclear transport factor 2 family protein [Gammaproteobacteria bacterium]